MNSPAAIEAPTGILDRMTTAGCIATPEFRTSSSTF